MTGWRVFGNSAFRMDHISRVNVIKNRPDEELATVQFQLIGGQTVIEDIFKSELDDLQRITQTGLFFSRRVD